MKIKQLLLCVFFISFSLANYSQQWHQYSDSIMANIQKNDLHKASRFIELADSDIELSKVAKDTIYADYLYRKGLVDWSKGIYDTNNFLESLAIWELSKKVNYFKVMKVYYFLGANFQNTSDYNNSYQYYERCYLINKKHHLPINDNFSNSVFYLAYFDFKNKNYKNAKRYATEYIELNNETCVNQFNFKCLLALEYKNDLKEKEQVLLKFLTSYDQKQLNEPNLLFKINFELFFFYSTNRNVLETIKYGKNGYELYQKANLTSKAELKLIILTLISMYGDIGDSINHDKFEKLAFELFPEDYDNDYYAELDRLMKANDFETFKIKFDEYEADLKFIGNYDELFSIYALSITLFEQNILFKKDVINNQIEFIQENKSSLSAENKLYFDILLAEYFAMTNNYAEALKICNVHLNEKDVNLRLLFYKYKSLCEMSLGDGNAKQTAYKTLEIANSIYTENSPQLLPYLSNVLLIDVMGEDTNSTKIATKAMQIMYDNKLERTDVAIGIWISLGNSGFHKKSFNDARVYYTKAMKILDSTEVISNPVYYSSCLLQLANINMLENDFEKSLEFSNKLKWFLDNNPQIPQLAYGDYYDHLGHYYFYQDQFVTAKTNYEKSFAIYGENISKIRKINYILCDYFINNDVDKAILFLEKYQKENKGSGRVSKIIYLLKYNAGDLVSSRNLLVSQLKNLILENNEYFHLLSDDEKRILYKNFSDQFEFMNTYLLFNDPSFLKEYINFRFYSKSLLFSNSFKTDEIDHSNKELYSEMKSNAVLINMSNESKIVDLKETESLKMRNREIEKLLLAGNSPLTVPTLKDLNLKLKINEAYVEIIRINKQSRSATKKGIDIVNQFTDSIYYGAIVVKKDEEPQFIVLDDKNLMESNYFPDFKNHIQGGKKLEKDLSSYSLLFEKVDSELNKIDKVYLVTDGVYNSINVEAIYNPIKKKYILEYIKINLIQNVRSITDDKNIVNRGPNLKAALFGNPDFDLVSNPAKVNNVLLERDLDITLLSELKTKKKIGYLPGTEREIQSVNSILKGGNWSVDIYSKDKASEENLKKNISPNILHIATHGFFNKNDSRNKKEANISSLFNESSSNPFLKSGLLLSGAQNTLNNELLDSSNNGIFSAEEAKSLDLKNTELVVLSACETGLGENLVGEGVIGLQRAFMIAGAQSVIMSLWKVDDTSTQELMTLFYTNWIQNKMNKADAFYEAKLEMKKIYPQPYYWAGFVLLE